MRRRGDRLADLELRRLPGGRNEVVHEVGADAVAIAVKRDELHERDPESFGEPAVDLPLDDHRVDTHAAVVDRYHPLDLDLTRALVDVDDDRIGAERVVHVRRGGVMNPLDSTTPALRPI